MLPDDRLYDKVTKVTTEQNIEECFAKMRWEERRKEQSERNKEIGVDPVESVVDNQKHTINFNNKRAASMKCNQRVFPLEPSDVEIEIKRDFLKVKLMDNYKKYIKENCHRNGAIKKDNLNPDQRNGMRSLKERVENNEIVVTNTDKSNKFSVMNTKTYEMAMEEHVSKDKEISVSEANRIAGVLNKHSKCFVKIIGIGKSHGNKDHKRAVANTTVHKNGEIPIVKGTDKDHKPSGLHMRAICNGMVGPKKALSEMVSESLEAILEVNGNRICKSTEEILYMFEQYNKQIMDINESTKEKIIGSMDVKSLYPSIEAESAAEIVKNEIIASNVTFEGLDMDELGRYLRNNLTTQEIVDKGLADILPFKIKKKSKSRTETSKRNKKDEN